MAVIDLMADFIERKEKFCKYLEDDVFFAKQSGAGFIYSWHTGNIYFTIVINIIDCRMIFF